MEEIAVGFLLFIYSVRDRGSSYKSYRKITFYHPAMDRKFMINKNILAVTVTSLIVLFIFINRYLMNCAFENGKNWMDQEILDSFDGLHHLREGDPDVANFMKSWERIRTKVKSKRIASDISTPFRIEGN